MRNWCRNVTTHKGCKFGSYCHFAHSLDEVHVRREDLRRVKLLKMTRQEIQRENTVRMLVKHIGSKKNDRNRQEAFFSVVNPLGFRSHFPPPAHLVTPDNCHLLQQQQGPPPYNNNNNHGYYVSHKTSLGERRKLLCDLAGNFYDCSNRTEKILVGSSRTRGACGFVLDVEETKLASGETIYLAFGVLCASYQAVSLLQWPNDHHQGGEERRLGRFYFLDKAGPTAIDCHYQKVLTNRQWMEHTNTQSGAYSVLVPADYADTLRLLKRLVQLAGMPNLVVKPMYDASMTRQVWEASDRLPYAVNGLVFIPKHHLSSSSSSSSSRGGGVWERNHAVLKWQPTRHQTINVALGGPLLRSTDNNSKHDDNSVEFATHLHVGGSEKNISDLPVEDVVYSGHGKCRFTLNDKGILVAEPYSPSNNSTSRLRVSGKMGDWVAHRIVEVCFDLSTRRLRFVRLRRGKKRADGMDLANRKLERCLHPLEFPDLLDLLSLAPNHHQLDTGGGLEEQPNARSRDAKIGHDGIRNWIADSFGVRSCLWDDEHHRETFVLTVLPSIPPGGSFILTHLCAASHGKEVDASVHQPCDGGPNLALTLFHPNDLARIFGEYGFALHTSYKFDDLALMFDVGGELLLQHQQQQQTSLYKATVFRKTIPPNTNTAASVGVTQVLLYQPLLVEVLSFLDMQSLVTSRCVSNFFRGTVELMCRGQLVEDAPRQLSHGFLSNLEPCAVAAYLRMGGSAVEAFDDVLDDFIRLWTIMALLDDRPRTRRRRGRTRRGGVGRRDDA